MNQPQSNPSQTLLMKYNQTEYDIKRRPSVSFTLYQIISVSSLVLQISTKHNNPQIKHRQRGISDSQKQSVNSRLTVTVQIWFVLMFCVEAVCISGLLQVCPVLLVQISHQGLVRDQIQQSLCNTLLSSSSLLQPPLLNSS